MPDVDTEQLLDQAAAGDEAARGQLLQRHRTRLKRMVTVRADPRLVARVDPSDVVQETLIEAAAQLGHYLRRRPLPFYPWLRGSPRPGSRPCTAGTCRPVAAA
jgi:RNA polymerase sigma-70 factor (ECF subfamily)